MKFAVALTVSVLSWPCQAVAKIEAKGPVVTPGSSLLVKHLASTKCASSKRAKCLAEPGGEAAANSETSMLAITTGLAR